MSLKLQILDAKKVLASAETSREWWVEKKARATEFALLLLRSGVRGGKKIYEAEKVSKEQFQAHAIFRAIGSGSHKSHMGDSGEVQT